MDIYIYVEIVLKFSVQKDALEGIDRNPLLLSVSWTLIFVFVFLSGVPFVTGCQL